MGVLRLSFSCLFVSVSLCSAGTIPLVEEDNALSPVYDQKENIGDDIFKTDTVPGYMLDELEVKAERERLMRLENGNIRLDVGQLNTGTRVLGEADLVLALKTLPGIVTTGDYGSGLMVDGAETSQTLFRIDGAPVYFPYRFGGIFSTFNSTHFKSVDFERNIHKADMPLRSGALVDVYPYPQNPGLSGMVNAGLLSSSLGLRYGDAKRWCVSLAGRVSYIDQLYGRLLKATDTDLGYNFSDLNFNGAFSLGKHDELSVGAFVSTDNIKAEGGNYAMDTRIKWVNEVASISWKHTPSNTGPDIKVTAYYSGYRSTLRLGMPGISLRIPASLKDIGFTSRFLNRLGDRDRFSVLYGVEGNGYMVQPQWCQALGYGETVFNKTGKQEFGEVRAYGNLTFEASEHWEFSAGLSLGGYFNGSYRRVLADPRVTVIRKDGPQRITFHSGIYHQYLHQTGFSEIGLASNFWSGATLQAGVRTSYNFVAAWFRRFPDLFDINVEAYYKQIGNSAEYEGSVLEMLSNDYNSLSRILMTRGHSYGANLDITKHMGAMAVRVGYGYGDGWRKAGDEKMWRSRTALGHSVKASADYRLGSHWSFSANFAYMSGRPYTPVKSIYIIAGNIMMDYGRRNSRRLPSYQRLDISANYIFKTGGRRALTHIVNLSFLNVYGHKNVEMQYFIVNKETSTVRMVQMTSLYRFLPSVSYTLEL